MLVNVFIINIFSTFLIFDNRVILLERVELSRVKKIYLCVFLACSCKEYTFLFKLKDNELLYLRFRDYRTVHHKGVLSSLRSQVEDGFIQDSLGSLLEEVPSALQKRSNIPTLSGFSDNIHVHEFLFIYLLWYCTLISR